MLGEGVDGPGDDVDRSVGDGLEEITAGHDAHPLIPRPVRRREVASDVEPVGQAARDVVYEHALHHVGLPLAESVEQRDRRLVLGARPPLRARRRQVLAERVGDRILARQRRVVARRSLHHRHVRATIGQRGDQRGRSRAAPDDGHSSAVDLEVARALLRVQELASVPIEAGELGDVSAVVPVVPRCCHHPRALQAHGHCGAGVGIGAHGVDRPARVGRRPFDPVDPMTETKVLAQPVLVERLVEVAEDGVTRRQACRVTSTA